MLDEAHERSVHTDILFALMKRALRSRTDLKVLVTSATLESEKFAAYFECPVLSIPGRTHPVDIYHSKHTQDLGRGGATNTKYVQAGIDLVLKIHR
jgi:ATP-dependent RNA helicase DHX8/PRP22